MAQFLYHLLYFVVKLWLRSDDMESVDELGHDFARVVTIFGGHHADEIHDSLDEARILKVKIDY